MKYSSALGFISKFLWVGIVPLFVVAEIVIFIACRQLPNSYFLPGLETKYFPIFIAALPMIIGINGYQSVKRRLSATDDKSISAISIKFLLTIVAAYAALIFCIGPLTQIL